MTEIDLKYIRNNVNHICRVCFGFALSPNNLKNVSEEIKVRYKNKPTCLSIKTMIESVTQTTVLCGDEIPSKVCSICLNCLKIAFDFKEQFAKAQTVLNQVSNSNFSTYKKESDEEVIEEIVLELVNPSVEVNETKQAEEEEIIVKIEPTSPRSTKENNLNTQNDAKNRIYTEETSSKNNNEDTHKKRIIKKEFIRKTRENKFQIIFKCKICERLYKNERNLKLHVKYNHNSRFLCEECGLQLFSKSAFDHHLRKHRGKIFKCDLCNKSYLTLSDVRAHKTTHKNERKYLCSVCGKNFNYPESLRYHMRLHTGEKNYVCTVCGLKYRMKGTLTRHMRTHTKEKPYSCVFCFKKFATLYEKKSHEMAIHTGERPYKCEYCDKGFAKSGNLSTHLLTHTGEFKCEFCTRSFIERKFLNIHLNKRHKETIHEETEESVSFQ